MRRPKNDYVPAEYGGYILNDGIPAYTSEDAGKALKVNQDGVGIGWHEDIYDNTKNLLRNGKPTFSMTRDASISTAAGLGSWVSWRLLRGSNTNAYEWGDGIPYFHFTYEASKTAAQSTMQLQKLHKLNNIPGVSGKELESLIPGAAVTLSFEFKSDIPVNLRSHMDAADQHGTRVMRILNIDHNFESAVSDWTKITVTDVIPYNFRDLFLSENTKDAFLMIQTMFIDNAHRANGDIYIRNIKLEYGKEATPYTYADIDQRLINYYIDSTLPEYSATDAGKALTVNASGNGLEWAAGGGIFWITTTETDIGDGTRVYRLDKTFLEIYTAMQNKMLCVIQIIFTETPPSNYPAKHQIVKEIYLDTPGAAHVFGDTTDYSCATINDYPEFVD